MSYFGRATKNTPETLRAAVGPGPRPPARNLGEHLRRTIALAAPVMAARSGLVLMIAVDVIMVGQAGTETAAAYGVAASPALTLMIVGVGLMIAVSVLTSQADGAGRQVDCGLIWQVGTLSALVCGFVFGAVLYEGRLVMALMDPHPDLVESGVAALRGFAVGLPGILLYVACVQFLEGLGRPVPGMVVSLSFNALNLLLNWLLIGGAWGFPELGAEGASLATSMTRIGMAAAMVIYVLVVVDSDQFGVRRRHRDFRGLPGRAYRRAFAQLTAVGAPLMITVAVESSAFMMMARFAAQMGALELASYQILLNLLSLVFMLSIGLAAATGIRVGNAVGRNDQQGMVVAGLVGIGLLVFLMLVTGLALWLADEPVLALYTSDPPVVAVVLPLMGLLAVTMLFDGTQAVLIGALRAMSDIRVPPLLQIIAFWGVTVPLGWYLTTHLEAGVWGLMIAILAGVGAATLQLGVRYVVIARRPVRAL